MEQLRKHKGPIPIEKVPGKVVYPAVKMVGPSYQLGYGYVLNGDVYTFVLSSIDDDDGDKKNYKLVIEADYDIEITKDDPYVSNIVMYSIILEDNDYGPEKITGIFHGAEGQLFVNFKHIILTIKPMKSYSIQAITTHKRLNNIKSYSLYSIPQKLIEIYKPQQFMLE